MSEPIQAIATNNYLLATPVGSGYMETSALEYDGDKISGYSGSAFAGGTDLEFDYDSDGNISGINSSAISDSRAGTPLYVEAPLFTGQSGDSAYIGCNITDTVLWSGDEVGSAFTINLNESISNFERIYVLGYTNDNNKTRTLDLMTCPDQLSVSGAFAAGTSTQTTWGQKFWTLEFTETTVHPIECSEMQWGTTAHSNMNTFGILKVVGINRKSV